MKEFFQVNGYIFNKDTIFNSSKLNIFGWGDYTFDLIYSRFEKQINNNIISHKDSE
jgi:hypothetical protein